MTAPVRRKTARERDRELIAKAVPWRLTPTMSFGLALFPNPNGDVAPIAAMSALMRETARIAREARKGKA